MDPDQQGTRLGTRKGHLTQHLAYAPKKIRCRIRKQVGRQDMAGTWDSNNNQAQAGSNQDLHQKGPPENHSDFRFAIIDRYRAGIGAQESSI
jgi:hypothetical protein